MIKNGNCRHCSVLMKSFFNNLPKKEVNELSGNIQTIHVKKGKTIYVEGSRPGKVFCIKEGVVKIYKTGNYGKEQIIRFATSGEFFGLRAVIGDNDYTSTAVAVEDSVICGITRYDFNELLSKYPKFSNSIITYLSGKLEEANNKITSIAQKPGRELLAETLITLDRIYKEDSVATGKKHTVIKLMRQDIANLTGTATETTIRLLSEFKHDKLISIKGREITLLNIEAIRRIADF